MELKEFVDSLHLDLEGEYRNDTYVINTNSSNDFSDLFNTISLNGNLKLLEASLATLEKSQFAYTDGYYEVILSADYDHDFYSLKVESR